MQNEEVYVIAIDGPGGSGKGSLAIQIARELNLHLLDSGAIYRLLALKGLQQNADLDQESEVVALLDDFKFHFEAGEELSIPFLDDRDVSDVAGDPAAPVYLISILALLRIVALGLFRALQTRGLPAAISLDKT